MSPKPIIESNSQYDPYTHDEHPALCECDVCFRLRYPHLYGYPVNKPGLRWSITRWACLALVSLAIVAALIGITYAGHALASTDKTPKPIAAPESLLKARYACPNTATLAECRGELRRAYAAIEWQRKQNLELARQMVGKLTDWECIHKGEGAWDSNTGNGYFGGLQQDRSFMTTYGRDMIKKYGGWAHLWTPRDQIIVAQRAFSQNRGYNPWPTTGRRCGLIR